MIDVSGEWAPRCRVQPSRVCVCVYLYCFLDCSDRIKTRFYCTLSASERKSERGRERDRETEERDEVCDVGPQMNHAAGRGK
jgi:hypothetical protein